MLRNLTMLASLSLFTVLLISGNLQIWMFIILAFVLLALIFGRFFCGWICPINTFIEIGTWIKSKLGIKNRSPKILQNGIWGVALLVLLVGGFILSKVTGKNLPLLLFMIPIGIIISITFSPASWHHWMCPYNVLFKITGGRSLLALTVNPKKCTGCAKCQKACPAESIQISERTATINKTYCLVCTACQTVCPADAISYGKAQETAVKQQVC